MIKPRYLLFIGFVLFGLLFVSLTISVQQSNPLRQFNVTPDTIYLNWTNNYASNITITINESFNNITVEILNGTSVATVNYSQTNSQTRCGSGSQGYYLFVKDVNASNLYNNTIGPLNATNSSIATIIDNIDFNHNQCSPGRYWINQLIIRNTTQTNEIANITVFIDIPISSSNTLTESVNNANLPTTGVGYFGNGANLPINATTYHSYYFNTSLVPNATGIMINLTGWSASQDIDLFLFDNSTTPALKAKSINKTHIVESLLYNYLPSTEKMWEIRVYGNSTSNISYNGMIIFTTLNVTNSSNLQVSSINFGVMNASELKQAEIILRNEGNLTLSNVIESKELYRVHKFGGNDAENFTFIVPDSSIATRVKVSLNWTGSSNYSFNLYNQNDSIVMSSVNKYVYANATRAMQEEYNETSSISTAGIWKVEVKNNSVATDPYNITVYVYVSPTNWISTNYTTMTFNRTGNSNYTSAVQINLTVQNTTMDGLYEGYIQYLDSNKAGIKIPISINVTTPMLVVNGTLNSTTIRIDEDYGINLTRVLNITLNNTGFYNLGLSLTNSSNILSGPSGYFANFTYNQITSINNYSSQFLNVNITFNSSMSTGVYEGWILFNATSTSVNLTSHPYESFNLTLRLNLTNSLDVRVQEIISADGDTYTLNTSAENVTTKLKIYYVNGTTVEAKNALNTSNFTIWLVNSNLTSHRIPSSGGLSIYNGTNPIYIDPFYTINFVVPASSPGGQYAVHTSVNYNKNPRYTGEGINQSLFINNTGLYMTCTYPDSTCNINVEEGSNTTYLNVSVVNYGSVDPVGGTISFINNSCYADIDALSARTTCTGSPSGMTFTSINVSRNISEGCIFSWRIVSTGSVSSNIPCTYNIRLTNTSYHTDNQISGTLTVTDTGVTTTTVPSSSSGGTGGSGGDSTSKVSGTAEYLNIVDYPTSISIEQGGSKVVSVAVNNTNKTLTQNMKLTIDGINSSWYSVNPSTAVKLKRGESYTFEVTFNIPTNASIGDYSAKFNATSLYINPVKPTTTFIYDTVLKSFTLKVAPGEALKSEITTKLSGYTNDMNSLEQEINQSKNQGYNTSEADSLLSQLKTKINQAKNYVSSGDYTSAYNLLDDIAGLINQTRTALTGLTPITGKATAGTWWGWGKWVVIVVVAIVATVLGYMLWPTKPGETKPTPGAIVQREVIEKKDKISETFAKLKERWKEIRKKREAVNKP